MERPKDPSFPLSLLRGDDRPVGHVTVAGQARTPAEGEALIAAMVAEQAGQAEQARELARYARAVFKNGYGDRDAAMLALVAAFHGLLPYLRSVKRAGDIVPWWSDVAFAEWAKESRLGSGALHAARFLLSVWNDRTDYGLGAFELHAALATWDAEHRGAFLGWVETPWWP